MKVNCYKTRDLGESAILLSKGFILLDTEWQGDVAYFVFDKEEEAAKVAHSYQFGGETVVAKTFHDSLITLKRKILAKYNPRRFRKDVRLYASN